jgi:hypothetical protein
MRTYSFLFSSLLAAQVHGGCPAVGNATLTPSAVVTLTPSAVVMQPAGNATFTDWVVQMIEPSTDWDSVAHPRSLDAVYSAFAGTAPTKADGHRLLPAPRPCSQMVAFQFPCTQIWQVPAPLEPSIMAKIRTCSLANPYVTVGNTCYMRDCTALVAIDDPTGAVVPYCDFSGETTDAGPTAAVLTFADYLRSKESGSLHHMNSSGHWLPTVAEILDLTVDGAPTRGRANASAPRFGASNQSDHCGLPTPSRHAVMAPMSATPKRSVASFEAWRGGEVQLPRCDACGFGTLYLNASAQRFERQGWFGASKALTSQSGHCGLPTPSRHAVMAPMSATPKRSVASFEAWSSGGNAHANSSTTAGAPIVVSISIHRPACLTPSRHAVLAPMSATPKRVVSAFTAWPMAQQHMNASGAACNTVPVVTSRWQRGMGPGMNGTSTSSMF